MKYFPHDSNAFQDEKITLLYMEYGYTGLGLFYTALEKLTYHERPINTKVLKKQLDVGRKLEKCWAYMEEIGLLTSENGETFNARVMQYCETLDEKREKTSERVSKFRRKKSENDQSLNEKPPKFDEKPTKFDQSLSKNEETLSVDESQLSDIEYSTNSVTRYNRERNALNIDINKNINIEQQQQKEEEEKEIVDVDVVENCVSESVEKNRAIALEAKKERTPQVAPGPPLSWVETEYQMLSSTIAIEAKAMNLKKTPAEIASYIGYFVREQLARGTQPPHNVENALRHFSNWLPGHLLRTKDGQPQKGRIAQINENTRAGSLAVLKELASGTYTDPFVFKT